MPTIVIPMAGAGSRFLKAGYSVPKYLIEKNGKTLLELSLSSLPLEFARKVVFVAMKEHTQKYDLLTLLRRLVQPEKVELLTLEAQTNGQAETVLAAKEYIDVDSDLIIYNIDTVYRSSQQYRMLQDPKTKHDGILGAHMHAGNNWSFARVDSSGFVIETAEKRRISRHALTGFYHFSLASDFLEVAQRHVESNTRFASEFYVAPLYNDLIQSGRRFVLDNVDAFVPLGTPDELDDAEVDSL